MSNPWDVPPIPSKGDKDENDTYAGIGRVTSAWEGFEFTLSRIYTAFAGAPDAKGPMDEYGIPTIFRNRLAGLARKAEEFFVAHPHQEGEGLFDQIIDHAVGYADRRNEVAHGIVFNVAALSAFPLTDRSEPQFAIVPPLHTAKKHIDGWSHKPAYAYTSVELKALSDAILELAVIAEIYRQGLTARWGE